MGRRRNKTPHTLVATAAGFHLLRTCSCLLRARRQQSPAAAIPRARIAEPRWPRRWQPGWPRSIAGGATAECREVHVAESATRGQHAQASGPLVRGAQQRDVPRNYRGLKGRAATYAGRPGLHPCAAAYTDGRCEWARSRGGAAEAAARGPRVIVVGVFIRRSRSTADERGRPRKDGRLART